MNAKTIYRTLICLALILILILALAVTSFAETPEAEPEPTAGETSEEFTGFRQEEEKLVYYKDGKNDGDVTRVIYDPETETWYNVVENVVEPGPTVAYNDAGWWYIDKDGKVDFGFTGFSKNASGTWYCKFGKVDFSVTGVVYDPVSTDWFYVKYNQLTKGPDVQYNDAGWWYIDPDGKVDFTKTSVEHNAAGWWRVDHGKVNFNFTGLASNNAGTWYCKYGKVDFSKRGGVKSADGKTWLVQGGKAVSDESAAAAVLDSVGWDLKSAFNWSKRLKYYRPAPTMDPSYGAENFAAYGFEHKSGNCYVLAGTFWKMAQLLGYNANPMAGQVPYRDGSLGNHGWVEVYIDGKTYVCDPNFEYETGRNGYMFFYKTKGTWVYSNYAVMK